MQSVLRSCERQAKDVADRITYETAESGKLDQRLDAALAQWQAGLSKTRSSAGQMQTLARTVRLMKLRLCQIYVPVSHSCALAGRQDREAGAAGDPQPQVSARQGRPEAAGRGASPSGCMHGDHGATLSDWSHAMQVAIQLAAAQRQRAKLDKQLWNLTKQGV